MEKMSVRAERVGSAIKRCLSLPISKLASEASYGLASISNVKLSRDLSVANIYINILGGEYTKQFLDILRKKSGLLRSIVAKEMRMRTTPELRFFYDDTLEQIQHIEELIIKANNEAPYREDYGDGSVYDEKVLKKVEDK